MSNGVLVRIDGPENLVSKNFAEDTSTVSPPILCSKSCEVVGTLIIFYTAHPGFILVILCVYVSIYNINFEINFRLFPTRELIIFILLIIF